MKIMIAYDGSRNAKLALVQTITMFRELKPQITLVAVAENPRDITAGNEDMFQEELSDLKRHLLEAQAVCEEEGIASETLLLEGDARKMLLYAAENGVPECFRCDYCLRGDRRDCVLPGCADTAGERVHPENRCTGRRQVPI